MPELPEVEVVRAGLAPAVTRARIAGVEVLDARSLKRHEAASGDFERLLTGERIEAAVRRGKFLWMPLAGGAALVGHLGMSGQLLLRTPDHPGGDRHARIRLHLEHPDHGELRVDFVDQRIFGSMAVDRMVPTADGEIAGFSAGVTGPWARSIPSQVAHIARDPLDPAFRDDRFTDAVARRSSGIKRILLDQGLVSGIGNIYADEALWRAKINGARLASSLTKRQLAELLDAAAEVMTGALSQGGTSFDSLYVNVNGESGYFERSLEAYGRVDQACRRCGAVMQRDKFMNRSSYYCPKCQPPPRIRRTPSAG